MSKPSSSTPSTCPNCGQSNQCAQAGSSTPVTHCWCFDITIDPQHLSAQTAYSAEQSCLCPACASGQNPTDKTNQ